MSVDESRLGNENLTVTISDDGLVARATIDRPERYNALDETVFGGLTEVLEATHGSDLRVVVVRGADGTFSSGGDLQDMDESAAETLTERRRGASGLADVYGHMVAANALTVAAVEGYCLAGGCGLAAGCDFVLAADDAEFGTPEVGVGLFPMQAMAALMRAVGEKKGLKLMFTGEHVGAAEAEAMGLATDVLDGESFDEELDRYVDRLAANSPVMISMGKEAYYTQRDMPFEAATAYLAEMLTLLMESEDHAEGVRAFLEDREPSWQAR